MNEYGIKLNGDTINLIRSLIQKMSGKFIVFSSNPNNLEQLHVLPLLTYLLSNVG
jgi:hypothetical protein